MPTVFVINLTIKESKTSSPDKFARFSPSNQYVIICICIIDMIYVNIPKVGNGILIAFSLRPFLEATLKFVVLRQQDVVDVIFPDKWQY